MDVSKSEIELLSHQTLKMRQCSQAKKKIGVFRFQLQKPVEIASCEVDKPYVGPAEIFYVQVHT